MSYATLNGTEVEDLVICMPLQGVWTARARTSGDAGLSGRCIISVGGTEFRGTIRRSGTYGGAIHTEIAGGTGGMSWQMSSAEYHAVPASIPVRDVLSAADSQPLSAASDGSLLAIMLPTWVRSQGAAADCMSSLMARLGASWRVLRDGSLWIGTEQWQTIATKTAQIIEDDPGVACAIVYTGDQFLLPGYTWESRRLSYVVHTVSASNVSTEIWYE